jgi:hypothetical protein
MFTVGQTFTFSGVQVTISEITSSEITATTPAAYAEETGVAAFVMFHDTAAVALTEGGE